MATIEEARDIIKSHPISTIITYYHPISKKGANFEGICPFHGDTTPSLKINDGKGLYKCFACGAVGDAIKFVRDKLNLEFVDAVKEISSQIGISIDEYKPKQQNPKFEMGLRVLSASQKIYRKIAIDHTPDLFKNFLKDRNINEESLKNFQLGFAPPNSGISSYLNTIPEKERSFAIEVAESIGIIRKQKHGNGHYDFYRDRIVFPIWDHSGKVRGYSSRAVKPDQKPKYLNSGESFIFDKGNILYGFNLAKNTIRETDSVIIVEGNMDVLMLHQFGFKNSVATMGVSLSQNSIKLLSNMTKNFYLAMDSDPAGITAMKRINSDLLSVGIIAKFINFSPAKDPDEFLNEFGRLELVKKVESASSFIDFLIEDLISDNVPKSTDRKLAILTKVFKIVSPLKTHLFATEKLIQCAKSLGLKSSSEDIIEEYKGFLSDNQIRPTPIKKQIDTPQIIEQLDSEPQHKEEKIQSLPLTKTHKAILETFISHPECTQEQQITEILDLIDHFEVKRIVLWIKKIYSEIDEADYIHFVQSKMNEVIPEQIKEVFASCLFNFELSDLNKKVMGKMLDDLHFKLKESALKNEREEWKRLQKVSQTDEESLEIITKIQKIEEKLLELRNK